VRQHDHTEFIIRSNGGGKDVSIISEYENEKEILFPPGTRFKVLDVEKDAATGMSKIYMAEIS
jgi:hypothetical protein